MVGVASLELPDRGVLGQRCTIQLQLEVPNWMAHVSRMLDLPTFYRGGPPSFLSCLLLLRLFLEDQLPLLGNLFLFPFLLQVWDGEQTMEEGRGGGSARRSWDPKASLEPAPYPSRGCAILFFFFFFFCTAVSCLPLEGCYQHMQRQDREIRQ